MDFQHSAVVTELRKLIEICRREEFQFRCASVAVANLYLQTMFREFSRQRADQASELQQHLPQTDSANEALTSSNVRASIRVRPWSLPSQDVLAILGIFGQYDSSTLELYREVLKSDLPRGTRQLIHRQIYAVRAIYERIHAMRQAVSEVAKEKRSQSNASAGNAPRGDAMKRNDRAIHGTLPRPNRTVGRTATTNPA